MKQTDPSTGEVVTLTVSYRSQSGKRPSSTRTSWAARLNRSESRCSRVADFRRVPETSDDGKDRPTTTGWVMDYPDAQNMMQLLYGPNKPPGINSAGYQSPEYDKLYEEMAKLDDTAPEDRDRKSTLIKQMHGSLNATCRGAA